MLLTFCIIKMTKCILPTANCQPLKAEPKAWKVSYCFNDSKQRRMALSCSKKISALLRKTKHDGDFYCVNCLHSLRTNKLLIDVKIILKNHLQQKWVNIFHKGFSVSTISSFKAIESKHDVYRGKDCMKKFCESLTN